MIYPTDGTSMLPTLWPGLRARVMRASLAELRPGDLVVVEKDGKLILHRYLARVPGAPRPLILTKGDALPTADAPADAGQVLGKVTRIGLGGFVLPSAFFSRWAPRPLLRALWRVCRALRPIRRAKHP